MKSTKPMKIVHSELRFLIKGKRIIIQLHYKRRKTETYLRGLFKYKPDFLSLVQRFPRETKITVLVV